MIYASEQLREWAEYLAGRGSVWTLPDGIPKPSDVFRAHADALEEIAKLRVDIKAGDDAWHEQEEELQRLRERLVAIDAAGTGDVREAVAAINVALCGDYLRNNDLAVMGDKFKPCEPTCECVGLLKARALLESLSARLAEVTAKFEASIQNNALIKTGLTKRADDAERKLAEREAELKWIAAAGRRTEREYEDHHKGQEGWTFLPEVGMWARLDFDHHAALARAKKAEAEVARLRGRLHEIAEEWAGAECGEPVTAQEGYAIGLCKRMYRIATEAK